VAARAAALAAFARCRQTLHDDLGVEPGQETTALYEQIRTESSSELRVKSFELSTPQLKTQNSKLKTHTTCPPS
jgi:DNA-binding SARP family transcriptional activator